MVASAFRTRLLRVLSHKLLRCRACQLKWFPRGGVPAACPACGGTEIARAFELFHLGIIVIVLAAIAWMLPSIREPSGDEHPAAAATASMVETKPAASLVETKPATTRPPQTRPSLAGVQRTHPAAPPLSATIKAKKLAVRVQRGPAKGHTLTLRRGEKVTVLDRKDRRFLVRDRRGNLVYVPLDKLTVQKTPETRRQYVQR